MGRNSPRGPRLALFLSHVHSPCSGPVDSHHARPGRSPVGPTEPSWLGVADPGSAARASSFQTRIVLRVFLFGLIPTITEMSSIEGSKQLRDRILFEIRPKPL
jgi:hypothetical protein